MRRLSGSLPVSARAGGAVETGPETDAVVAAGTRGAYQLLAGSQRETGNFVPRRGVSLCKLVALFERAAAGRRTC